MKKLTLLLTIAYFLIIIALPCFIVFNYHHVLLTGEAYKIRITGYDPYDPFRGRYIAVRPELYELRWADTPIVLCKDSDGFVTFASESRDKNSPGYIGKFRLTGYYVNEKIAPSAESAIIKAIDNENNVYVLIKVKNGKYAVEGMYINGIRVEEYVK